jgi:signal peptidase I
LGSQKARGGARVLGTVFRAALIAVFALFALSLFLIYSASRGVPRMVFNLTVMRYDASDMQREIPFGSVMLVLRLPPQKLAEGDDIVIVAADARLYARRIVERYDDYSFDGHTGFRVQAAENPLPDNDVPLAPNILGKVLFHTTLFTDIWVFLLAYPVFLVLFPVLLLGLFITLKLYSGAKYLPEPQSLPAAPPDPASENPHALPAPPANPTPYPAGIAPIPAPPSPAFTAVPAPPVNPVTEELSALLGEVANLLAAKPQDGESAAARSQSAEYGPQPASSRLWSMFRALVCAAAAVVLLHTFLFPVYAVQRSTMTPLLSDGEYVLLFAAGGIKNGDVVAFHHGSQVLIKRVIAAPGDWVELDGDGTVLLNGAPLYEPYLSEAPPAQALPPLQVPEGQYFVLCDRRAELQDSRSAEIGLVRREQIVGKTLLRVWPPDKLGLLL